MLNLIKNELDKEENISITENGAIGYSTSGSALVDINYQVSSLRNNSEDEIVALFDKAFHEDKKYTLKWLFFARDIREGLGERRLFRICYKRLAELDAELFIANLDNIAEYGRWDDLVSLIGISHITDEHIGHIIQNQLSSDLKNLKDNKPISLLAKWLPSENASSQKTKKMAKEVRQLLSMSARQYRVTLSQLRKHLRIVEGQMCSNQWDQIDYETVPSLANLKYKNAFLKHDYNRRITYLGKVAEGTSKINMSVATPVDVVSKYMQFGGYYVRDYDSTLELAWQNLKDVLVSDTLVVADGSGSMAMRVSGHTTALSVANALAIYTSEHNSSVYKDKYITFSNKPKFVDFSDKKTLRDKLEFALEHDEVANTNIEAVFDLILQTAINNKISQDEMIDNILIISDMEFDKAQKGIWRIKEDFTLDKSLFASIQRRYNMAGYQLPKLIFWNVNSRTKTIPLTTNDLGVILVSGFSQNILKMVMSDKYDPYEVLKEILDNKRYDQIKC